MPLWQQARPPGRVINSITSEESLKYNVIELYPMHKTASGERRQVLLNEAQRLKREGKLVEKAARSRPGLLAEVATILAMAENALLDAQDLKDSARLEDLHIWEMKKEKDTKKGVRTYNYWMASWRESGRVRHVYLGSCRKISQGAAMQKARKMKAQALGLKGK
jgi:hypothetical protein